VNKADNPEQILIISQWTTCLSLVSDYLSEKGIGHVKYQGDMNREKRDVAVRVFMSKEKAKIMLMSLKCGGTSLCLSLSSKSGANSLLGVGLNLTRANNVISLDLAWSRAVESQAWDRVHRLGQKLPVKVDRIVIADTVEDRIMALQERKQSLADGSLGEGKGKKIGKLTVRELGMSTYSMNPVSALISLQPTCSAWTTADASSSEGTYALILRQSYRSLCYGTARCL
jgi:SNF2 family DNA or RNA helicase